MPRGPLTTLTVGLWLGCGSTPPPPLLESRVVAASVDAAIVDASPAPIIGQIVGTQPEGADVVLKIDKGLMEGVAKRWTIVVIDGRGAPIPDAAVALIRVDKHESIGVMRGRTFPPGSQVRFSPPTDSD